jgi:hypothetical protein
MCTHPNYIISLAKSLPVDVLTSIISQIPPVKQLEYAITSNNKDLVLLVIDNMDISIKNELVDVEEDYTYYNKQKKVKKNFYDNTNIFEQLFNFDYDLYCRLIHRCNDNMISIILSDIFYGKKVDGKQPSFALMDNMDTIKPVFDNLQYSYNMMENIYDAIRCYGNPTMIEYVFFQTIKLFSQEFIDFLNETKYLDHYTDNYEPRILDFLHSIRYDRYSTKICEFILIKIFDGGLIIPKHLIYRDALLHISDTKMYHMVKYYKPTSSINIQDIFNWYCYKNSPYCQYIVKNYNVNIPTFDTFLKCYHKSHYYYDEDRDAEYYNKKVNNIYEKVKKYLFSLGGSLVKKLII